MWKILILRSYWHFLTQKLIPFLITHEDNIYQSLMTQYNKELSKYEE